MLLSYMRATARSSVQLAGGSGLSWRNSCLHSKSFQRCQGVSVVGSRRLMATSARAAARAWFEERMKRTKKFLDHNPFVKLSLYGTAVFMTGLACVDYMMKGKKKAGPREITVLPFDCGGFLLQRQEEVDQLLALSKKVDLSWKGTVNVVGVRGAALCGKTELLRQFALTWKKKEGTGKFRSYAPTVLSVEAHDVDDVIVQLHGCASRLGCRAGDVVESASGAEFSQLPPDEQIGSLCRAIRGKLCERGRWLFVVDGDVAQSCLARHLPVAGDTEWGKGLVVYASSDPAAATGEAAPVYEVRDRLTPVQSLELLLATSTDSHNAELLRVDLGTKVDEVVAGGEKLCEQLGHTPMAVALAGSLVRWKQTHQRSDFWFNECAEQLRERVEAVTASLGPSSSSYPSSTLALVAAADLLAEEILSAGQSPDYQQAARIQSLGRHSYSSDTMVRENLAALGWLAADAAPVAVAFLRKHMQNPDFDLERAREQQLLQQRQQLEAMEKMMLSAEKTSSSSTPDLWTTVKSALPFGMGQSSPPPLDDSPGTASSPTSPQPQVGPNNGPDVVDDTLSTMQDYHLVRRSEISDCSVIRMSPHLATAVRRDYLLHGAERAEQRHISRESSVASMKSQWGQRMNRFDAGRCRLDYRRALQAQLDRHHGNQRPSQRLADAFKFVDGVLESKVPKAVAIRSSLIASAAAAGSSSKDVKTKATATSNTATSTTVQAAAAADGNGPVSSLPVGEALRKLDSIRGDVAAAPPSDSFLRLHRLRLLSAIATTTESCPDTVPGHVLRRCAAPAIVRIHDNDISGHGNGVLPRLDGGANLWRGVSPMLLGEQGRVLGVRAHIASRCYRLHDAGIAMLRESAECFGKAYGDRSATTLNALNLLGNELRSLSLAGSSPSITSTDDVTGLVDRIINIEDTISPMSVTPEQAACTASTLYLLARCHGDNGRFDESLGLLERCLMLQQQIINSMDGHKYIRLYASTLIDIGNISLCDGKAVVALKTFSLALTLLRAVHGDDQVEVERALQLQGAAHLFLGDKEKSRESRSQATGVKQKTDMAALI